MRLPYALLSPAFRKEAARRGMKEIAKALEKGLVASRSGAREAGEQVAHHLSHADRLAKTPGVVKPSAAGSEIRARMPGSNTRRAMDLGQGSEGQATLVAHPEHGVSVRKLYRPHENTPFMSGSKMEKGKLVGGTMQQGLELPDPDIPGRTQSFGTAQGISTPEMISRKAQAGRAMRGNSAVAQFHGEAATPQNRGTMHFNEYIPTAPGGPKKWSGVNPAEEADYVAAKQKTLQGGRQAGFHNMEDVRPMNMAKDVRTGQVKTIDYLPMHEGETINMGLKNEGLALTPQGQNLLRTNATQNLTPASMKAHFLGRDSNAVLRAPPMANNVRGATPKIPSTAPAPMAQAPGPVSNIGNANTNPGLSMQPTMPQAVPSANSGNVTNVARVKKMAPPGQPPLKSQAIPPIPQIKLAEYAPGIPSKEKSHELPNISKPKTWQFAVHDHDAKRRGRHFDLRLGDPDTGHAHSWAMPAKWPKPGEKSWAIQQPTHTVKYMDFEGDLPPGYGEGGVKLFDRDKTEVIKSSPGHINFNVYRGTGPEEYTLHRIQDKKWVLYNRTLNREKHPDLPDSKPKYKEQNISDIDYSDDNYVVSAKIDDAHNLFYFPESGEPVRVLSYRKGKRSHGGIIEHTHKVPVFRDGLKTPKALGGTILRGGLYALDPKTGKATPAHILAGMLNSDVWKSREKQKENGELIPVIYDVVQYRGKKMEGATYEEKLKVLRKVVEELPHAFHLPRMAFTADEKEKLVKDMKAKKIPETKEGVVLWNLNKPEKAIKAKFTKDHDVYIRSFFPGEGKYTKSGVGGFYFSHDPTGPIVGRVGTGLSDAERRDMHQNPENYIGLVARVKAQEKYKGGALRAPSFLGFHLDKNLPEELSKVKMASADLELEFIWGRAIA